MKIAIDARMLRTSTGRYIERLLEHLQQIDTQNQYWVILDKKDFESWQPKTPNFHKLATSAPVYSLAEQTALCWQLYRLRADLVHFCMPNYPIVYFRRFVTTVHDLTLIHHSTSQSASMLHKVKRVLFRVVLKAQGVFAQHIIVPTKHTEQLLHRLSPHSRSKTCQIYEAAEPLTTAEAKPLPELEKERFILYVGNAYPYKNLPLLIDAFAKIREKQPDIQLVLAGKTGPFYEDLRAYAPRHAAAGVHFTGYVSDEQLVWLYENARLYVFPSLSEGFGLPGLEAMQYQVPVLAAEASCLPEVYADAAVYFDPCDTDDLVQKLEKLLRDEPKRQRLVRAGQRRVTDFSWHKMAEQTLTVYRESIE